jgi:predicted XRE-type DNA-binding protein
MSKNVFSDLGFSDEESARLKIKSCLLMALQEVLRGSALPQAEVAKIIDADQCTVLQIRDGNLDEFSTGLISSYLQRLGYDIHLSIVPCPADRTVGTIITDVPKQAPNCP